MHQATPPPPAAPELPVLPGLATRYKFRWPFSNGEIIEIDIEGRNLDHAWSAALFLASPTAPPLVCYVPPGQENGISTAAYEDPQRYLACYLWAAEYLANDELIDPDVFLLENWEKPSKQKHLKTFVK